MKAYKSHEIHHKFIFSDFFFPKQELIVNLYYKKQIDDVKMRFGPIAQR